MFHVGQFVVCVDDSPCCGCADPCRCGRVYVVSGVIVGGSDNICITLEGVVPPAPHDSWLASRFRPLADSRLAVFRNLLAPTPKREREPA